MGKVKKFAAINIKKIPGGKDPVRLIEDFILRHGFDPDECRKEHSPEFIRWMVSVSEEQDLEIFLDSVQRPVETTVYLGVNIGIVPIRGSSDFLAAALEIADGLIGVKISLVGHYLVLSASMGISTLSADELDYTFKLIQAQQSWFIRALTEELGINELPEE